MGDYSLTRWHRALFAARWSGLITPSAMFTGMLLETFAEYGSGKNASPAAETLADLQGVKPDTVYRNLKVLRNAVTIRIRKHCTPPPKTRRDHQPKLSGSPGQTPTGRRSGTNLRCWRRGCVGIVLRTRSRLTSERRCVGQRSGRCRSTVCGIWRSRRPGTTRRSVKPCW